MTILNTFTVSISTLSPILQIMFFCLSVLGIVGIIFAISALIEEFWIPSLMFSLLGIGFIGLACSLYVSHEVEVTRYEVTIDETVSFQEIMNQYDIINQRGNIYVIQGKNEENK